VAPAAERVLNVILLRQPFQLLQEHEPAVGRDFEPPAARLACHIIVDADEVVLRFVEQCPIARVSAAGNLSLFGTADPPDRVVVRAFAAGALKAGRALLRLLGKELSFVHIGSVHEIR
jgi:hypothetical protein